MPETDASQLAIVLQIILHFSLHGKVCFFCVCFFIQGAHFWGHINECITSLYIFENKYALLNGLRHSHVSKYKQLEG